MAERKRVLITDRFSQDAMVVLQSQNFLQVDRSSAPQVTAADLEGVHGLIIRSKTHLTRELIEKAKNLQVVITATSGFDHIDLAACARWGITVMHTPWANVNTASQLTWTLVLACAHKLTQCHNQVKAGEWNRDSLTSVELSGKTYGIVGLGRIGSRVAEIAQAFDMEVIAFDPYVDDKVLAQTGVERVSFEELLKRADVISFHVPLTGETRYMLNRSQLEYIHRGIILVNTSRGPVIQEQALCEALEKGWIGACGLDVFEKEPLSRNSHLLRFPNVIFSPHMGAHSQEAFEKASEQAAMKLIAFFRDGTTSDTLPPKVPWFGL